MKLIKVLFFYILGVMGIISISIVPSVIAERGIYNVFSYITAFVNFFAEFCQAENWVYIYKEQSFPIVEFLREPLLYSAEIFFSAIAAGFLGAFVLTLLTYFLPSFIMVPIKRVLNVLETVPDLMFAFMLQLFAVYLFKQLDTEVFTFTALGDEKIYFAPILTLSILPLISMYRLFLMMVEEEFLKDYTEFALAKGMGKLRILTVHILRNVFASVFYHSKLIVWGGLSSLFIVETLFNMRGITYYMIEDFRPIVIAVSLLLIFTPFFLLYQGAALVIQNEEKVEWTLIRKDLAGMKRWKLWKSLAKGGKLLFVHMQNPKFCIGFIFIMGFMLYSFFYVIFADVPVEQINFLKDAEGKIISAPPHPPSSEMIFGSDRNGRSILDEIIVGARYTLFFAILIAVLRVAGGFALALRYVSLKNHTRMLLDKVVDSIHFLPLSLIAYLLLRPILWSVGYNLWVYSLSERLTLEVLILTVLVLPLTTVLIGSEIKLIEKETFVLSAKTLGGDQKHIFWTHVFPHLSPRMFILFGQQFIQVMLIFVHLGLFQLFLGGSIFQDGILFEVPDSSTFEWGGMIGATREAFLSGKYWIILPTLGAFMFSIFAMQLIIQGVKEVQQRKVGVRVPVLFKRKRKTISLKRAVKTEEESFALTKSKKADPA
ncbi:ABC transporter permease subunit [Peribacillus kribbensis]|uniref:ABC transporter permease subunit n=1 Tax=Peribacillus kribbensis TaxID=356658 RepID=UPI00041EFD1F|nr:ABC transporter permease subunit [Peribacillus kribbensis]